MSKDNNKNDHIENFGHNRSVSFEQYEKMLKSYRHLLCYASQEMRRCKRFLDEAFTKYPNSNSNNRKLKDFEIHESRNYGIEIADKFNTYANQKIENIDKIAAEHGYKIPGSGTLKIFGEEIKVNVASDEVDNEKK